MITPLCHPEQHGVRVQVICHPEQHRARAPRNLLSEGTRPGNTPYFNQASGTHLSAGTHTRNEEPRVPPLTAPESRR